MSGSKRLEENKATQPKKPRFFDTLKTRNLLLGLSPKKELVDFLINLIEEQNDEEAGDYLGHKIFNAHKMMVFSPMSDILIKLEQLAPERSVAANLLLKIYTGFKDPKTGELLPRLSAEEEPNRQLKVKQYLELCELGKIMKTLISASLFSKGEAPSSTIDSLTSDSSKTTSNTIVAPLPPTGKR